MLIKIKTSLENVLRKALEIIIIKILYYAYSYHEHILNITIINNVNFCALRNDNERKKVSSVMEF